jgi:hypothetical protein
VCRCRRRLRRLLRRAFSDHRSWSGMDQRAGCRRSNRCNGPRCAACRRERNQLAFLTCSWLSPRLVSPAKLFTLPGRLGAPQTFINTAAVGSIIEAGMMSVGKGWRTGPFGQFCKQVVRGLQMVGNLAKFPPLIAPVGTVVSVSFPLRRAKSSHDIKEKACP